MSQTATSGRFKRFRRRITRSDRFIALVGDVAALFTLCYYKTLRIRFLIHSETQKLDLSVGVLFAFWHGRQFVLIPAYAFNRVVVMADLSWAGEIQTRVLTRLGYTPVRGSARRHPARALIQFNRQLRQGLGGCFAVDGPHGPIYRSKPGILFASKKSGYPIIPITASAAPALVLRRTWCQYLLPAPFSRCLIVIDKPEWRAARGETMTTDALDATLSRLTAGADAVFKENCVACSSDKKQGS